MEYTEEMLQELLQKEGDKRVTEALKTAKANWEKEQAIALATAKADAIREAEERAKLSAEELARKEFESKVLEVTEKEKTLSKKQNTLLARELLTEAGVPKAKYEGMLGLLVSESEENTTSAVQNLISMYTETKTEIETTLRAEFAKVPPPTGGGGDNGVTKEDFAKMGYAEKMTLKNSNPELFKTLIT